MIIKNYPKLSIITPSFNQARYLEKTILSVINQKYPNLEYIIIDGGSTDGSLEIIKKYEKQLSYWISESDKGQYHAIQKGFNRSTGEIMGWINSDDAYHSNAFFSVAEIFQSFNDVKWFTGTISFLDETDRIVRAYNARKWSKFNFYNGDYGWVQQESTFWRRNLWEKAGKTLNLDLKYAADFELWMRFFRFEKLHSTDALLGGFRIRKENQKTLENLDSYMEELFLTIKIEQLNNSDLAKLKFIKLWENKLSKLFLINRIPFLKKKYNTIFDYPPYIIFDRDKYKFLKQ